VNRKKKVGTVVNDVTIITFNYDGTRTGRKMATNNIRRKIESIRRSKRMGETTII